jgi:hypothetical protein
MMLQGASYAAGQLGVLQTYFDTNVHKTYQQAVLEAMASRFVA